MNLNFYYCTYRTTHPSGFYYEGKGVTSRVLSGVYKGSGIRFKLALTHPGFEVDTWTTTILNTYETEDEAFTSEANLVTLESLSDPYRLNLHVGGSNGKYQTHARLLQKYASEKKAIAKKIRVEKEKEKKAKIASELKDLKKQLKEKV